MLDVAASDPSFLPLAIPGLVTVALFAFINSWNEFLAVLDFHESGYLVHRADFAGRRASGTVGAATGGAAGERDRLDYSLSRRVSRLAALLHFGAALGRRQMNYCSSDGAQSGDVEVAAGARTIRDVARLAGVSIGTVSKALNANGRLSAETRARVLRTAKAIHHCRNDLAQNLHRARSMTVGILSNDSFGRFAFPIVEALERRLFDQGIAVFMCNATDDLDARAAPHRPADWASASTASW